jgi:uncharacterized protein (TIGR03435 family)
MQFILVAIAPVCLAQSSARIPSTVGMHHKLAFEVASVRENKSGGKAASNVLLDRGNAYSPTGGAFTATNQYLVTLIIFAYKMGITESWGQLMRSLPSWAKTDRFDINARAASREPTKDDMRLMAQSLLEDRFKLRVHRENRKMPVFGLYLKNAGKPGPQLKSHDPASSCSAPLPLPAAGTPVERVVGLWPAMCGDGDEAQTSRYRLREGGRDMTMDAMADWLTGVGEPERPILDRTGLKGTFDFAFEFDPEYMNPEGVGSNPRDDSGSTFIEAIKEQLGLQLKKEDGVVSLFVVDNIEYPSPN